MKREKVVHATISDMNDSVISAILFDVGGVLVSDYDIQSDLRNALHNPEHFDQQWPKALHDYESGFIDESMFLRRLGCDHPSPEQYDRLTRGFRDHQVYFQNVITFARSLTTHGLQIGILSNAMPSHSAILQQAGIYDGFRPCLLSWQIGHHKPERGAFISALSALNLSDHPEHVLFIDNHQNNLDAAAACGMHTLLAVRQATQAQTEQMIIMGITDKLLSLGVVL